jgi:hypothetical protein
MNGLGMNGFLEVGCSDRNGILFEAGGESVQQQEGALVIQGSNSGGGL